MKTNFCEVCSKETNFERIKRDEEIIIRGLTFTVSHEYDKCANCKELFEPYEDIDKNIKKDYQLYREKVDYFQPEEVLAIRKKYGLTVREFAAVLGIGYSTLSNIENGALQNDYQNTLFEFSSSPSVIYNYLLKKNSRLKEPINKASIQRIKQLAIEEKNSKFFKDNINITLEYVEEKRTNRTQQSGIKNETIKQEEVDRKWTGILPNILLQN